MPFSVTELEVHLLSQWATFIEQLCRSFNIKLATMQGLRQT